MVTPPGAFRSRRSILDDYCTDLVMCLLWPQAHGDERIGHSAGQPPISPFLFPPKVEAPDEIGTWGLELTFAASRLLPAELLVLPWVWAKTFFYGRIRAPASVSFCASASD